ncbi:MAG: M20 family metallo-hydrolase [Muribaculaceae bacterium]
MIDIDELYYDAVDLLKAMIATKSVSREENDVADVIEAAMRGFGLDVRRSGNNLWVLSPDFDPAKPTLLLNSHIDTVKPVDCWTRDPFAPEEDGEGRLYGLGSNDAGASVVSLMATFRFLTAREQPCNYVFLASCEEEVSGRGGVESVLPMLPRIDVAIVGEPTMLQPAIAEKGLMVLDGEVHGVSGHAARNEGVNAIYKAMEAIERLRTVQFERESQMLGPVKVSVTQINAGTQHNVVPDRCILVVDVRTTDAYSNEATLAILQAAVGELCELKPRSTRLNPSHIDRQHTLVQRLLMMGKEPFGSPTLSDQALMPFPSLKLGPGDSARSHTADEYIVLDEIREAIHTYVTLLDGYHM